MMLDNSKPLGYRLYRDGRVWCAFLKRAQGRPLFYVGRTKHEALTALMNGVAKMAATAPARLWPPVQAAQQAVTDPQQAAN